MSRIVIALGGNALGNNPQEQQKMIEAACPSLIGLINQGHEIIISHGNGPQVGMINKAFEIASSVDSSVCPVELMECTAMSQGYIGYHLQKGIKKELRIQHMPWHVASVVTQVVVDKEDPAFKRATKPIGGFLTKERMAELKESDPTLEFVEDSGRGYRRVVASPKPVDIVERDSILNLLDNEYIVIACGGGGIPVYKNEDGDFTGIPAVIDKDFASAKLAEMVDADYLFILTAVDHVAVNFGKPDQKELKELTLEDAKKYCEEGQFAPGSMLPKVQAAILFAESKPGRNAVIGSLEKAPLAMIGESGTRVYYS
ncbi:carbamate kinase [Lacrimispora sp.]|uniref:carbamate kinase n=1 Tax=Lacrimispora sp. TaxID=2719234 RepID=UPI00289DAA47|nr:carbamate kinase [Lacrimispora sp.]